MKKSVLLSLPLLLGLLVTSAIPQAKSNYPSPPPSLDSANTSQSTPTQSRRLDLVQLQRDADDLARTAQTIPTDVASVRKGMLPKDVIDKLKQIEKLSKRLRTELNP